MNLFLSPPSFLFLFSFLPFFVSFLLHQHIVLNSSPTSLFFLIPLLNPYLAHHLTLYQML